MKLRSFSSILALCAIVTPLVAGAQQATFADIAKGSALPNSIKIADLSPEYRALRIQTQGKADGPMGGSWETYYLMARSSSQMGVAGEPSEASRIRLYQLPDILWTKGETMSVQGHDYLVGYRLALAMDPISLRDGATTPPRWTANLVLKLVRNDSVASIEADPDMTPDQLRVLLRQGSIVIDTTGTRRTAPAGSEGPTPQSQMYTNAKQISLGLQIYSGDYDDLMPYVQGTPQLQKLVRPYLKNDKLWESLNPNGSEFRFAMNLAGVSITAIEDLGRAPMLFESNPWPDGRRIVAFADGHVKLVDAEEWEGIEPWLKHKYPRSAKKPIKG